MKLTSILSKFPLILIVISILSCSNETIDNANFEENEDELSVINSVIPKKVVTFLKQYEDCFTLVTEEEETEVLIEEETGEVNTKGASETENEDLEDYSTIDLSDTPFPITLVLSGETENTIILNAEELLDIIESCIADANEYKKKHTDKEEQEEPEEPENEKSLSKINAQILNKYKNCFEVITDQGSTCGKKKRSKYDSRDLTFPIAIIFDNETIEIVNIEELNKLIKTCYKRGCNEEETCTLNVEIKEEFDGEGITIYVDSENENLTYEWSNGDTSASIYIFANSTVTYSVEVTDQNGCTTTESITIEVNEN